MLVLVNACSTFTMPAQEVKLPTILLHIAYSQSAFSLFSRYVAYPEAVKLDLPHLEKPRMTFYASVHALVVVVNLKWVDEHRIWRGRHCSVRGVFAFLG